MDKRMNIVFFHPDLGIGGAERLVIDAAVGLQSRGHKVTIFTSHCDPKHCFDEARDGTLDVRVRGNLVVPPSILSRFSILCAILRQLHLILWTYLTSELESLSPDVFIADQLSAGVPWLRYLYPSTRILFYCHFPDLLLTQGRAHWWKRAYRVPFDFLEEWSMSFADAIAVNSEFTRRVVKKTWPKLTKTKELQIVYPCVNVGKKGDTTAQDIVAPWPQRRFLLSINRFERKKNIALAIKAYAGLDPKAREGVRLVLAGGYDNRVQENVVYHKELVDFAENVGLKTVTTKTVVSALNVPEDVNVLFLLSVPNTMKDMLLKTACLLLYTPSNEHFGIVPLEAMLAGLPVLATNSGGPLETVVDGETGWLRDPNDVESWTAVIHRALRELSKEETERIGDASVRRIKSHFSDVKMSETLEEIMHNMASAKRKSSTGLAALFVMMVIFMLDAAYGYAKQNGFLGVKFDRLLVPPFALTALLVSLWMAYLSFRIFHHW